MNKRRIVVAIGALVLTATTLANAADWTTSSEGYRTRKRTASIEIETTTARRCSGIGTTAALGLTQNIASSATARVTSTVSHPGATSIRDFPGTTTTGDKRRAAFSSRSALLS